MSTQQDIYATGSENRPPMLNKENYVPWSSRLLRYAKSRPNGKLFHNSIMNGPYVRRMIPELGDPARTVPVPETFHEQTDDELTEAKIKQMEADDQVIQTILLGLPEDIYAAIDSCEIAQEIWLRVQQMMKGSDIGIQEKKAKLFNEWEMFTSIDRESIESYYHRLSKLMNDFKRNKHFPKKIASNLKFLNNLQPEWSRHVTILHQTKNLHTVDYTQLYDFLKYNQKEVDELRAKRLAKTQDPLALMANSNNSFKYLVFHPDLPSSSTYIQQPLPNNNNYNPQPSFNQNYMQQPMPNLKDITDPTTTMNMELALMAKAFKLNYFTPTNNNQKISSNPRNRQIAQPGMNLGQDKQMQMNVGNQNGVIVVPGIAHQNGNGNVVAARAEGNANGNNGNLIRCYNCRGLGHLVRNYTVRPRRRDDAYLQTQLLIAQKEEVGIQLQDEEFDLMAAVANLDVIEDVNVNCILMANMQRASTSGTQIDKAPIYDSDGSAEVQLYDNCYNDEIFNMFTQEEHVEQGRGTVEQHPANVEETRVLYDSLYNNLATEVKKVNSINRKLRETNYVYQEQCLSKKLSKEKSIVSSLQEEKKRLKFDFKIREDGLLDKQIQLENKVKELDNILINTAKFVRDFQSLANEADKSLSKDKALELEIERLLRAVVKRFENCIIKKENEYAKLWNDWYKKCEECKYDKISYDKAYNDMQQKIERLQAQLGDQKGKSRDTPCVSDTLDPLFQKLENENVELEFQIRNYEKENAHLKAVYKNLFDSINVTRTQTKAIIDSLQNKLHDTIYENAKLRAQLFDKVSEQKDTTRRTSANT
ncbi:hypothetical protein Tco_1112208 [Tanacetum coccineum]|uniref:CCHC-type domain-containing protein n=1 Tax=Tanacetum coccineum TaxID=301880 RepID=A0ABQ5IQ55_9ASTR